MDGWLAGWVDGLIGFGERMLFGGKEVWGEK